MFHLRNSLAFNSTLAPVQIGLDNWRRIWCERVPEDANLPESPENLWKQVGFLRQAPEFWQLARIKLDELMSATHEDEGDGRDDEGSNKAPSRYDNTDMGDMNGLIMEYRRLNLNESK